MYHKDVGTLTLIMDMIKTKDKYFTQNYSKIRLPQNNDKNMFE